MTHEELIKEIKQLPLEDRRALLDEVFQLVREETPVSRQPSVEQHSGIGKPDFEIRDESPDSQRTGLSLSQRLSGILKFDGNPPNDEEVKDLIADYLIRKYS